MKRTLNNRGTEDRIGVSENGKHMRRPGQVDREPRQLERVPRVMRIRKGVGGASGIK